MYKFNIIITELCNANCSHCYMSSDSQSLRKTMTKEQIGKIIDNLPNSTDIVVLTGGEVFLVKDLLYFAIDLIKNKNPNIMIGVESNGKYFYIKNNPYEELIKLKDHGVDFIRFSDDIFHKDGGIDLTKVLELKKYENNKTPKIKFLKQDTAVPIGEAEKLPDKYKAKSNCMNNIDTEINPYIFVDVNGDANLCTWKCIPSIGNMMNNDFSTIENALKDTFNNYILKGDIENAIAYRTGKDIEEITKESLANGQCSLCIKHLKR